MHRHLVWRHILQHAAPPTVLHAATAVPVARPLAHGPYRSELRHHIHGCATDALRHMVVCTSTPCADRLRGTASARSPAADGAVLLVCIRHAHHHGARPLRTVAASAAAHGVDGRASHGGWHHVHAPSTGAAALYDSRRDRHQRREDLSCSTLHRPSPRVRLALSACHRPTVATAVGHLAVATRQRGGAAEAAHSAHGGEEAREKSALRRARR